jgi:acyl-CoA dehydrogenase
VPAGAAPEARRYYRQLTRYSAAFAFLADVSMLVLGGSLKRREKLSARLGDILSMMYLASATLKRYEDEGRQHADRPLLDWSMQDALYRAQGAFEGVLENFPSRALAAVLRRVVFPFGKPERAPSDQLGHQVAKLVVEPSASRDRLTVGMYLTKGETDIVGTLEAALDATMKAEAVETKVRAAQKVKRISGRTPEELVQAALAANVISPAEQAMLARAAKLRDQVVKVDDFPQDFGAVAQATPPVPQRAAA